MENQTDIQIQLFNKIRDQLPSHVSLADEISEVLEISNDSAYRRIRGEKPLSIHEVQKLCLKYQFSIDDLAHSFISTVTFRTSLLDEQDFTFINYFKSLLDDITAVSHTIQAEVIFILNELNLFHVIQIPEICAFKLFFWQKSNLGFPGYKDKVFSVSEVDEEMKHLISDITNFYVKLKTIELTTEEALSSFLKQILFYYEAGFFNSKEDALILCEKLFSLLSHMQKQAELGFKFPYGKYPVGEEGNFQLYYNDIVLSDNTVLVQAGDNRISYITSNAINLLQTYNKKFFEYNYQLGKNLIKKSTLISGTAEKERNRFFLKLREQIHKVIDQL